MKLSRTAFSGLKNEDGLIFFQKSVKRLLLIVYK